MSEQDITKLSDAELRARIEVGRKASADKAAAREAARKRRELEERVRLVDIEAQHGVLGLDIDAVFAPDGSMVVVKRPAPVTFERFESRVAKSEIDGKAISEFVVPCLVYPSVPEYEKIVDKYPGVQSACAGLVGRLGSAAITEASGK